MSTTNQLLNTDFTVLELIEELAKYNKDTKVCLGYKPFLTKKFRLEKVTLPNGVTTVIITA